SYALQSRRRDGRPSRRGGPGPRALDEMPERILKPLQLSCSLLLRRTSAVLVRLRLYAVSKRRPLGPIRAAADEELPVGTEAHPSLSPFALSPFALSPFAAVRCSHCHRSPPL